MDTMPHGLLDSSTQTSEVVLRCANVKNKCDSDSLELMMSCELKGWN